MTSGGLLRETAECGIGTNDKQGPAVRTHEASHASRSVGPSDWLRLLLLFFLAECLWVVSRQQLSQQDYRYAECGREMWERPSPLAGYFTTCGNLNGDGTFAYRVAGLPLTVQRLAMLGADKMRRPENRLYAEGTLHGSMWEARHELFSVTYLLHLPFVFFAIWLGGGLWWVSRRSVRQ